VKNLSGEATKYSVILNEPLGEVKNLSGEATKIMKHIRQRVAMPGIAIRCG